MTLNDFDVSPVMEGFNSKTQCFIEDGEGYPMEVNSRQWKINDGDVDTGEKKRFVYNHSTGIFTKIQSLLSNRI